MMHKNCCLTICVFGVDNLSELRPEMLNKSSVIVKAQMTEFVFSALYLMNQCYFLLISNSSWRLFKNRKFKIELKIFSYRSKLSVRRMMTSNVWVQFIFHCFAKELFNCSLRFWCSRREMGVCDLESHRYTSLEEKPQIANCRRIRQQASSAAMWPFRFRVRSSDIITQIMRKAKQLREWRGIELLASPWTERLRKGYPTKNLSVNLRKSVQGTRTHTIL